MGFNFDAALPPPLKILLSFVHYQRHVSAMTA